MFFPSLRHMLEIQALQSRQKEEIDGLFTRMGKLPPPSVCSPAVAMAGGRRRRKSHRSARSSGQPSPIHSGTDSELTFWFQHRIFCVTCQSCWFGRLLSKCLHSIVYFAHMFRISSLSSECSWFRILSKAKFTLSNRDITSSQQIIHTAAQILSIHAQP